MKQLFLLLLSGLCLQAHAQVITTIAGNGTMLYSGDGSLAVNAGLANPYSIAIDNAGNMYIADRNNNRIRKVDASGIISTIAGTGAPGYSGDGAAATDAKINYPLGVAVDGNGSVYFTDRNNECVRKVNNAGIITTIAGTTVAGYSGDGGAATLAQLSAPAGICIDALNNVYICDVFNDRVRKINSSGVISTVAGNGTNGYDGDGGMATLAKLNDPYCVALDTKGNMYITEYGSDHVRKISNSGVISTIAGTGVRGNIGDGGAATLAELDHPIGIAVDKNGNVFIADADNNKVRKINTSGVINTIAGTGKAGFSGDGGSAITADLYLTGIALDAAGNLYIADLGNNRVRYIRSTVGVNLVNSIADELILYPNPSNGTFNLRVSSTTNEPVQIRIMNELGATIKEINTYTNQSIRLTIDVPGGIYMLMATTQAGSSHKKVCITGQ